MVEGLTAAEARARLREFGPNAIPEEKPRLILLFLKKIMGACSVDVGVKHIT